MGSKGSAPPFDGIPLVNTYQVLDTVLGAAPFFEGLELGRAYEAEGDSGLSLYRCGKTSPRAPLSRQSEGSRGVGPFNHPPDGVSLWFIRDGFVC
jgi:hypothetical protein